MNKKNINEDQTEWEKLLILNVISKYCMMWLENIFKTAPVSTWQREWLHFIISIWEDSIVERKRWLIYEFIRKNIEDLKKQWYKFNLKF